MPNLMLGAISVVVLLVAIAEAALATQRALQHWRRSQIAKRLVALRVSRSRTAPAEAPRDRQRRTSVISYPPVTMLDGSETLTTGHITPQH
jgi:hypothetical protein